MKLSEIKKIEESFFSGIFPSSGKLGGSGISGLGTPPNVRNFQTKLAKVFIDDFYRDAVASLENGIEGGYIDPNKVGFSNQPAQQEPQGKEQPGQPATPSRNAAPANNAQQSNNMNYPGLAAGIQVVDNNPLIFKYKNTDYSLDDDGEWANTKTKAKASETLQAFFNKQADAVEDAMTIKSNATSNESLKFDKLNAIFEAVMKEMIFPRRKRPATREEPSPDTPPEEQEDMGQVSIAEYMFDWFSQYMQGVNWQNRKQYVQKFLLKFEKEYGNKKQTRQNLLDLGKVAFAMSKAGASRGQYAAGAPEQFRSMTSNKQSSEQDNNQNAEQLVANLVNIADRNPEQLKDAFKSIKQRDPRTAEKIRNAVSENRKRKR